VNSIILCASSAPVPPSVTAKAVVCAPPAIDFCINPPAICSISSRLVLVFVPHVPAFSPVA